MPALQPEATPSPDGNAVSTFVAQTVQAGSQESTSQALAASQTAQAGTALPTPSPEPSATLQPAPSPVLPTFTFTPPGAPLIVANVDTNCRAGPSPDYARLGYLLAGQKSSVLGRNNSSTWWYIANPTKPAEACWVWGDTTVVSGDSGSLAIITPPPLPSLAYLFSFTNRHDCGGDFWFSFWAQNTGNLPIRSASLTIIDRDSGITYGPLYFNLPFLGNPNACSMGNLALESGAEGFLVSDLASEIPSGARVRVVILLCSQDNLEGACQETRIDFNAP